MKKLLTILFVFSSLYTIAQQEPYYTHFKYNVQSYNPAAAGEHLNHICIVGVAHYQWRGYEDVTWTRGTDALPVGEQGGKTVAPETNNVNLSYLFGVGKSGRNQIGLGIAVTDDQVNFSKTTTIHGDLNFRRLFDGGFRSISVGVGLGTQQFGIVNPNYKALNPNDPIIPTSDISQGKFNMNAGVFFQQQRLGPIKDFYGGLSVTQVNAPSYQLNAYQRDFIPHAFAIVGGDYPMSVVTLEPAVLIKLPSFMSTESYRPQVDLHCTALYANTFRGGLAFRQWATTDALSVLLGYKKDALEIGYSYDITASAIQSVSNGTHEVMVKYCIPISYTPPVEIIRLTPRFL